MADGDLLRELQKRLREFVGGNQHRWEWLVADYDLLRRALREAVEQTDSNDPVSLLDECWNLLTDAHAEEQVEAFYRDHRSYRNADVDAARLYRNACALVATAQAAVAARQAISHPDACVRLVKWAQEAATLLGGQLANGVVELHARWTDAEPAALIHHAYDALAQMGWRVAAARYWTRHWLRDHREGDAPRGATLRRSQRFGGSLPLPPCVCRLRVVMRATALWRTST